MKNFVMVAGVVALAAVGWRWHQPSAEVTKGGAVIADRMWIDHIPTDDRDRFDVFAVLTREKVTFFEKRSRWLLGMELGRYELGKDELRVVFPQTGSKEAYKFAAAPCHENGFDFCLQISGGTHGVQRYYSKKNWVVRPGTTVDALAESIATH